MCEFDVYFKYHLEINHSLDLLFSCLDDDYLIGIVDSWNLSATGSLMVKSERHCKAAIVSDHPH